MSAVYGELDETGQFIVVTVSGDDYDLSQAADAIRVMTPAFNPVPEQDNTLAVPLSWVACAQLAHSFPGGTRWDGSQSLTWTPGPELCDWTLKEIMRRTGEGEFTGLVPALEPMKHQRAAAIAIGMNGRFILADDMGTGKTLSYLMGLAELEARGRNPWPALLVTPSGVVDTVLEELPRFYPWKAAAYAGSNRAKWLKSDAQLLVMGYETMRNDIGDSRKPGPLLKFPAGAVVWDECHFLCNYDSLQSRMARRLSAHVRNVIAGSGTPITASAAGFWPVINSLYPESFPHRDRYKERYCISKRNPRYGNGDRDISGLDPLREPEFRDALQGSMRRVAKEDVLDLPPKLYQVRYVDIPPAWRAAYDQMEEDMLAELPDVLTPLEARTVLAKMTRLRQLACSACDVEVYRELEQNPKSPRYGEEVERTTVTLREPCWKGAALVALLDELHQAEGEHDNLGRQYGHTVGSRPAIAFAESQQLVRIAGAMAERKGYKVGYIDGKVSKEGRKEARLAFQNNELDLICVTTQTGGAGLNLTAADTVAFLARPWGYVPAVQAEDRAYRKGQTKPVTIYDFVTRKSVESRVLARLREKAGNLAELVRDRRIVESFLGGRR